jgi:hypothetical protein
MYEILANIMQKLCHFFKKIINLHCNTFYALLAQREQKRGPNSFLWHFCEAFWRLGASNGCKKNTKQLKYMSHS